LDQGKKEEAMEKYNRRNQRDWVRRRKIRCGAALLLRGRWKWQEKSAKGKKKRRRMEESPAGEKRGEGTYEKSTRRERDCEMGKNSGREEPSGKKAGTPFLKRGKTLLS